MSIEAAMPELLPVDSTRWTKRLAFELALMLEGSGEPLTDVLETNGFAVSDLKKFNKDPVFLRQVQTFRDEIARDGVTFKMKARAQAEELLKTSWLMIHAPDVSPNVKADLIKSTVKWGGLEPKQDAGVVGADGGSGGVRITINLNEPQAPDNSSGQGQIIDAVPSG